MKLFEGESLQLERTLESADQIGAVEIKHPAMIGLNMDTRPAFLLGYQDCAEEALRFLMEVEHLSNDHPLVTGLKHHLQEQQMWLRFGNVYYDSQTDLQINLNDSGISIQDDSNTHMATESNTNSEPPCEMSLTYTTGETITTNQLLELASLQNNSAVSGLAEELLSLLEESEDSDDDDGDISVDEHRIECDEFVEQ